MYVPKEIIIDRKVENKPVTHSILSQCPGVPVGHIDTSQPCDIIKASRLISNADCLSEIIDAGKKVLALVATTNVTSSFDMPDHRIGCPHFEKLVLVNNGCPFKCQWCFLQQTYRGMQPFMAVHVRYKDIMKIITRRLEKSSKIVVFNNGELQDSLALEHLTHSGQTFIPFFGRLQNGRLFMLTKSDNVKSLLGLAHNGHTILAWSLNAPEVSQEFEIGAASFERRLNAAKRAQEAGYPVRIRLDPIVPVPDWERKYAAAIKRIFEQVKPERITLGTLRFESAFVRNRESIIGQRHPGSRLLDEMAQMIPMLAPMPVPTGKRDKEGRPKMKISVGKMSYPENLRIKLFRTAITEIRKYFGGPIALCKEVVGVWYAVGLNPRQCECVCQYESADLI